MRLLGFLLLLVALFCLPGVASAGHPVGAFSADACAYGAAGFAVREIPVAPRVFVPRRFEVREVFIPTPTITQVDVRRGLFGRVRTTVTTINR